ncbi:MAG: hypothetical protein HY319_11185 [Armatimonadetes bacterium]|nr:hypothetical protein [Armatimonadota bacterium]
MGTFAGGGDRRLPRLAQARGTEVQAIDRPLTTQEQATLRKYSSRATITASRFAVDYSWGDFKRNAAEWIETYFDAFLYPANWGTHELMLRLRPVSAARS